MNLKTLKRKHFVLIASLVGLGAVGTLYHFCTAKITQVASTILDTDEDEEGSVLGIPHSKLRPAKPSVQAAGRKIASGCTETWRERFNAIMTQNLLSGKPWYNTNFVDGYLDHFSYDPGGTIKFFYNGTNVPFGITIRKHGGQNPELISQTSTTAYTATPVYDECSINIDQGVTGWPEISLELPSNLTSGLYSIVIEPDSSVAATTNKSYIPFVVRNNKPAHAPILYIESNLTWVAYNPWGGGCVYNNMTGNTISSYGYTLISSQKPMQTEDPEQGYGTEAGEDAWFIKWMQENGYQYDVISDYDFDANPSIINGYKAVVTASHSEYWTAAMVASIRTYIAGGGNVVNTGGNVMYYKAVIGAAAGAPAKSQVQILRAPFPNGAASDGTIGLDGLVGGKWNGTMGISESSVFGTVLNTSYQLSQTGLKVLQPSNWVFEGTGVTENQMIGETGKDSPPYSGFGWNGNAGASGWEVNVVDSNSPAGIIKLASGTNPGGGADMTYYENANGGGVFSASSITYAGALAVDPILSRMQKNVFDKFLGKQVVIHQATILKVPAGWHPTLAPSSTPTPFPEATVIKPVLPQLRTLTK